MVNSAAAGIKFKLEECQICSYSNENANAKKINLIAVKYNMAIIQSLFDSRPEQAYAVKSSEAPNSRFAKKN